MAAELTEKGQSFLTFAKSRRNVEVILKEARDLLEGRAFPAPDLQSGFQATGEAIPQENGKRLKGK